MAAIPRAFSALGVYFLPRFADRNTARRLPIAVACIVAAALGLVVSSYAGPFARYRRTELLCSQLRRYSRFSGRFRSGAHRPGTGGRHRLLHHARRGVQLLAPLIRTEAEQRFHSPHAGLLVLAAFALLCAALLWALKTGAPT